MTINPDVRGSMVCLADLQYQGSSFSFCVTLLTTSPQGCKMAAIAPSIIMFSWYSSSRQKEEWRRRGHPFSYFSLVLPGHFPFCFIRQNWVTAFRGHLPCFLTVWYHLNSMAMFEEFLASWSSLPLQGTILETHFSSLLSNIWIFSLEFPFSSVLFFYSLYFSTGISYMFIQYEHIIIYHSEHSYNSCFKSLSVIITSRSSNSSTWKNKYERGHLFRVSREVIPNTGPWEV